MEDKINVKLKDKPDNTRTATDDNDDISSSDFETGLFALNPKNFGNASNRNYKFHSIAGVVAKTNPADAYLSTEPRVTTKCPSAVNPGRNFQDLSKLTGGLRFPVCDPDLYNTVFSTIANDVVAGAKVACEFARPPLPPGVGMFNKIIVQYTPGGGGSVQSFNKVADQGSCVADGFYSDTASNRVILCPQTCAVVQADENAKLDVLFTCEPEIN